MLVKGLEGTMRDHIRGKNLVKDRRGNQINNLKSKFFKSYLGIMNFHKSRIGFLMDMIALHISR